jgi:DNA repair exonuclease SbcCD ATPase subunit
MIKLGSLTLENFRGCKHYKYDFDGHSAAIYGANGAGKSTLADATSWLLTGKDQQGRADYNILPVGEAEGVEASVVASFIKDDGSGFSLRRVYKPVFTRKRGKAEKHRTGNTTDYYIDDVPQKAGDYNKFIAAHLETEEDILTVTRPDYFAQAMKPDARRQKLLELFAGGMDDAAVIAHHAELAPLGEQLGTYTVDDCVKRWKAQRRKVNADKDAIPGRIDEAERAKPAVQDLLADAARMPHLAAQRMKIRSKIDAVKSGESAASLRQQVSKLQADMEQARAEYIRKSSGENKALESQMAVLRQELVNAQATTTKHNASAESKEILTASLNQELKDLRNKAREIHGRQFDESSCICRTCHRPYPPEQVDEMRRKFNEEKAKESEATTAHGKSLKATYEDMVKQAEADRAAAQQSQMEADHLQQKLTALQQMLVTPPAWETTKVCKEQQDKIDQAKASLQSLSTAADAQVQKLQAELAPVEQQIQAVTARQSNAELLKKQDARIEELKDEEKKLGVQLANLDNLLHLVDRFVQLKAADVESEVNGSFHMVRWKLFELQVNGGVKACCEAQVDGKDYGSLSNAERVNAGLDIVDTLGQKMGLVLPVWVDNSESISHPLAISAQTISLYVSDKDKTVRTEVLK